MNFDRSRSRAGASRRRSGSVGHEPHPADEGRTAGGPGTARVDSVDPGLEALGAFLASDRAPPGRMTLPELDGLLASLAAGPGRVPDPGGWMPLVWGGGEPAFADPGEARRAVSAVADRLAEVSRQLREEPDAYRPVFRSTDDGVVIAADWARGFWAGVTLRAAAWEPLESTSDLWRAVVFILMHMPDHDGRVLAGREDAGGAASVLAEARREARTTIPGAVADLCRFWRERERGGVTVAPHPAGRTSRRG
jgi:uncharacterized protein